MKTIKQLNTTRLNYLSGRTALNIPSDEMTGDWNFYNYFLSKPHEYFIEITKNNPFGSHGIIEVSNTLKKSGVEANNKIYSANHYRAIADMFLNRIKQKHSFTSLFYSVDDWLNTKDQKKELFTYLKLLTNQEINLWMDNVKH